MNPFENMDPMSPKYEAEAIRKLHSQFDFRQPNEHSNAGAIFFFLALFKGNKFGRTQKPQDLKDWIKATRKASDFLSEEEKSQDTIFKSYASLLWLLLPLSRFLESRGNDMEKLIQTITMVSQQIDSSDDSFRADLTFFKARLFDLRFARKRFLDDLENIIDLLTEYPKEYGNSAAVWNNLGVALRLKYHSLVHALDLTNAHSVLNETVEAFRQSTIRTPSNHCSEAGRLGRYSEALLLRFQKTGDKADLVEAVSSIIRALTFVNDQHQMALIRSLTDFTGHIEAPGGQQIEHVLVTLNQAIQVATFKIDISEDWPLDPRDPKSGERIKSMKDIKDMISHLQMMLQTQLPPNDLLTNLLGHVLGLKAPDEGNYTPPNAPENEHHVSSEIIRQISTASPPPRPRRLLGTTGLENMGTLDINVTLLNSR